MSSDPGGLRRWTERFTVTSAASLVASLVVAGLTDDPITPVIVGLFGFVFPMIFGMAYLLLPPYVRRTLIDHRLPGVHFVLAYLGAGLLVVGWHQTGSGMLFRLGVLSWSLGVAVFLGSLLATVLPALNADPTGVFRGGDYPQRSTRLATVMIPVAIGYLVVATGVFLAVADVTPVGAWTLAQVIHLYAAGFGALLVFALSARLLIGFYHVTAPRVTIWLVLLTGAIAPLFLGVMRWTTPWFQIGAAFESVAMAGYLFVVAIVGWRTDRRRFGLLAILLGALAGVGAVLLAAPLAFGTTVVARVVSIHRSLILWGFFPLTIVGYAFLFFPVTSGQFAGGTRRGATSVVLALGGGLLVRVIGIGLDNPLARQLGLGVSILGAAGYLYLITRRFYG